MWSAIRKLSATQIVGVRSNPPCPLSGLQSARKFRRIILVVSTGLALSPPPYPCGSFPGADFWIAPVIGMKNTPTSRLEWIFPASSLV